MKGKVAFVTIGCKVNQCESASLAEMFSRSGWQVAPKEEADVFVVNTCTVTAEAERKCRQQIRKLAKTNPKARIVVMGCYAQVAPEEVKLPGVQFIVGTHRRAEILELLERGEPKELVSPLEDGLAFEDLGAGTTERTRATLKIQDGCQGHCTYCRVRIARGPVRSLPQERVLELAKKYLERGYKEIVLSGVNLGSWGLDLPGQPKLWQLIEPLAKLPGLARLRLSSIEPEDVSEELLGVMAEHEAICRHLHLPLQSGSEKVLKLMGRSYTPAEFAQTVEKIRAALPEVGLTADVMVAFPGEGEKEFQESLEFVVQMAFSRLHVFPYSKRPGTPALKLPGHLPRQVGRARAEEMIRLGEKLSSQYHAGFRGRTVEVLLEEQVGNVWEGFTSQYMRVRARGTGEAGQLRLVQVTKTDASGGEGIFN